MANNVITKQMRANTATATKVLLDICDACKEAKNTGSSEPIHIFFEDYQIYFITEDLPIGTMAFKGALAIDHMKQIMIDVYNGMIHVGNGTDRICKSIPSICYDDIFETVREYYEGDLDNMAASW